MTSDKVTISQKHLILEHHVLVWDCIGINPVGYAHVRRSVYPRDVVSHENEATVGLYVLLLVAY